jgi:hypothetical protein
MLGNLQRGADNKVDDKQLDAVLQAFDATVKDWSMSGGQSYDKQRFEEMLRTTRMYDGSSGSIRFDGAVAKPDMNGNVGQPFKSLLSNKFFDQFVQSGIPKESAIQYADWATARLMNNIIPVVGNAGLSEDAIKERMTEQVDAMKGAFHVPMIDGRGFGTIVPRAMAPNATWEEPMVTKALAEQNIKKSQVTDVCPSIGDGNSWWVMATSKDRKGNETRRFVQIDLEKIKAEQPVAEAPKSIDDILDQAKARMSQMSPEQRAAYAEQVGKQVNEIRRNNMTGVMDAILGHSPFAQ